ncbi:MAG: heme peroxidase family protein [Pseudomonadota bacterium]
MTKKQRTAPHHGVAEMSGVEHYCDNSNDQFAREGFFGRLFPDLPGLYTDPDILTDLGSRDGPMNAGLKKNRTSTVDVGQVFFGQFVDHDITLDTMSRFNQVNEPTNIMNVRTPTLDLDCIYGDGPEATPFLYVQSGDFAGVKLLTAEDGTGVVQDEALRRHDLVRSSQGTAVIGDPRNDENRVISQMQLAFIRAHNAVVDRLHDGPEELEGEDLFEEARELLTRHYHWAILHDFLPTMCGAAVVWDILHRGRDLYCIGEGALSFPFIPVEFSVAAYRFGHSMIPMSIQVQRGKPEIDLFDRDIFGGAFSPLRDERAIVDFHELFETAENRVVQKADALDTKLAGVLLNLPFITEGRSSLAARNLFRGQSFLLPSGEVVAEFCGREPAEIGAVTKTADALCEGRLGGKTPLWLYILAEAEAVGREDAPGKFSKGEGLGLVGARIVAEVLIGLMELDPHSFLAMDRQWTPEQGLGAEISTVGALVTYAQPQTP